MFYPFPVPLEFGEEILRLQPVFGKGSRQAYPPSFPGGRPVLRSLPPCYLTRKTRRVDDAFR